MIRNSSGDSSLSTKIPSSVVQDRSSVSTSLKIKVNYRLTDDEALSLFINFFFSEGIDLSDYGGSFLNPKISYEKF